MQHKDDNSRHKIKISMLDVQVFFRTHVKILNLTFAQEAIISRIVSRNGINNDFIVTQKMLAEDMNVDVSYIRKMTQSLIDKNIIILTKISRVNCYSISEQYRSNISANKINTAPIKALSNDHETAPIGTVYSASIGAVSAKDTIYRTRNKKLEVNNITPIFPFLKKSPEEESNKKMAKEAQPLQKLHLFKYIPISDNKEKRKFTDESFIQNLLRVDLVKKISNKKEPSEKFKKFWHEYPRQQGMKPCWNYWLKERLDNIADDIIADVINRKLKHEPWLQENGKYIVNPLRYLREEVWHDSIILQTINRGENANEQHNRHTQQPKGTLVNRAQARFAAERQRHASFSGTRLYQQQPMATQRSEDLPALVN